jgi:isocitrate dehydrogenase
MLDHLGWGEAARLIEAGLERAIEAGTVTYDLARLMREEGRADVHEVRCSEFATEIISNFTGPVRA